MTFSADLPLDLEEMGTFLEVLARLEEESIKHQADGEQLERIGKVVSALSEEIINRTIPIIDLNFYGVDRIENQVADQEEKQPDPQGVTERVRRLGQSIIRKIPFFK